MNTESRKHSRASNPAIRVGTALAASLTAVFLLMAHVSCTGGLSKTRPSNVAQNPSPISSPVATPGNIRTNDEVATYEGKYTNSIFGYAVIIPEGFTATGALKKQQPHGFLITLSSEHGASLTVDGSYNAPLWKSLDAVFKDVYHNLEGSAQSVELVEKRNVLLDGLPAVSFDARYVDNKTGAVRVRSEILGLRKCLQSDLEVIYTIALGTPENRFTEDNAVMQELVKSWTMLRECS